MRIFGLIGFPLGHSFSAGYFSEKFSREGIADAEYRNFPIDKIDKFPSLINDNPELKGLNVTIPYKEQVVQFLDELDEKTRAIGAVNTIKIENNQKKITLKGFNTDEYGFRTSLLPHLNENRKKALILGTGGASKAVKFVLDDLDINWMEVSRKPKSDKSIGYEEINEEIIREYTIIINTTPLGMHPDIYSFPPLPYKHMNANHLAFDLVYNPTVTTFMKKASEQGATIVNGLKMLELQAEKAWEIWNRK
ncbi:MAG: shikimate dehydrogenase family protein [Bacteroidales bacterium]